MLIKIFFDFGSNFESFIFLGRGLTCFFYYSLASQASHFCKYIDYPICTCYNRIITQTLTQRVLYHHIYL